MMMKSEMFFSCCPKNVMPLPFSSWWIQNKCFFPAYFAICNPHKFFFPFYHFFPWQWGRHKKGERWLQNGDRKNKRVDKNSNDPDGFSFLCIYLFYMKLNSGLNVQCYILLLLSAKLSRFRSLLFRTFLPTHTYFI